MLNEDTPPESATEPRSIPVDASKKSTLPVGTPEPGAFALTVALIVMVCPRSLLVVEAVAAIRVASLLIDTMPEAEPACALPWLDLHREWHEPGLRERVASKNEKTPLHKLSNVIVPEESVVALPGDLCSGRRRPDQHLRDR